MYRQAGSIEYAISAICWLIVLAIAIPMASVIVEHYS